MTPRVWITGVGVWGGLGDAARTWRSLCRGIGAVTVCRPDGADYPEILGAPAMPLDLNAFLPHRKMAKYMNKAVALTVAAAGMALENAGLEDPDRRRRMALFISTGMIPFDLSRVADAARTCAAEDKTLDLARMGEDGLALCHPLMPFRMLLNMPLGMTSIVHGVGGENAVFYPGADQGGIALEIAVEGIRSGRFDRALVGGGVHGLSLIPVVHQDRLGRVARPPLVPGNQPDGWALADAAAFLVLEAEEAAIRRRVAPLAEIGCVAMLHDDIRDPEVLAGALRETASAGMPDGIIETGSLGDADDARLRRALDQVWPHEKPALTTFDARIGYAGAAAVPLAVALAAYGISKGSAPSWTGVTHPRDLAILSRAPDESVVGARILKAAAA